MDAIRKKRNAEKRATQRAERQAITGRSSFTIQEFCDRNGISRELFYKLDGLGLAPRCFLVGEKAHRRITVKSEKEWQAAREADAVARKAAKNQPAGEVA